MKDKKEVEEILKNKFFRLTERGVVITKPIRDALTAFERLTPEEWEEIKKEVTNKK